MKNTTTTIYDVAAKAGVSLATVSRVLNNPSKVKEATRKRVLKVIEDLNYYPNVIARGLASRKTTTVGVIVSDIARASVSKMLSGILDIAETYNYSVKIFPIRRDEDVFKKIQVIIAEQLDGVLYLNDELTDISIHNIKEALDKNQIPFVFSNVVAPLEDMPMISIDYEKAGYELTSSMIKKGSKDIYFVTNVKEYTIKTLKERGYKRAMEENNLPVKILHTSPLLDVNQKHFNEYFSTNKIDGAVVVKDSMAISLLNVLVDMGKKVPEDVQVASFQNTLYAVLSRPQLTSIDTPIYDIGAVSMRLLTKLMDKTPVENIRVILPQTLIERKTTL